MMTDNAIETEKKKLAGTDTIDIIDYIKQSIEILMHMRVEEFELFQQNWEAQEKLRYAKIKDEKDKLKAELNPPTKVKNSRYKPSKLFEKVKHELMSSN